MYDMIIIGAGPGGMTAALYAARSNMKVLLLEQGAPGGQMNNTAEIENYPGYSQIMGPELSMKMYEPLENLGVENTYGIVQSVEDLGDMKRVFTEDAVYETKTIVIATGARYRKLGVVGEEEYGARGVSYCAVCDGAFFRDKEILVIGGGDSAVEEAMFLTRFGREVTIVHRRDELRAQKIIQERAFKDPKLHFIWDTVLEEISGDGRKVQSVKLRNLKTGEISEKEVQGVFIYVGLIPQSGCVSQLGITDAEGWIMTDAQMHTIIPGIFAIGDVRQKNLRQITTAVGDGATAASEAYKYITEL
ncbi:MAG: thioredoxin-disulfide reductase [Streptococcaceae bacterium]|nr:thioredoxin-disulfide reductase [Streptococcaceae bacterium]